MKVLNFKNIHHLGVCGSSVIGGGEVLRLLRGH